MFGRTFRRFRRAFFEFLVHSQKVGNSNRYPGGKQHVHSVSALFCLWIVASRRVGNILAGLELIHFILLRTKIADVFRRRFSSPSGKTSHFDEFTLQIRRQMQFARVV